MKDFLKVKGFLQELGVDIRLEESDEQLFIISDEGRGIASLVIDLEDGLLIMEQPLFDLHSNDSAILTRLMQISRGLIHGALVLDESGRKVIFRDTLQTENLDLNELEYSIHALSIALAEHADEFISFGK
jgi:hypothetical protein